MQKCVFHVKARYSKFLTNTILPLLNGSRLMEVEVFIEIAE